MMARSRATNPIELLGDQFVDASVQPGYLLPQLVEQTLARQRHRRKLLRRYESRSPGGDLRFGDFADPAFTRSDHGIESSAGLGVVSQVGVQLSGQLLYRGLSPSCTAQERLRFQSA